MTAVTTTEATTPETSNATTTNATTTSSTNTSTTNESQLPLRMISTVVKGFGRGSTDLGIPTANLAREGGKFSNGNNCSTFDDLATGIYWGFCRIGNDSTVYKTACSIGYNPTYGNKTKTVEPHLIALPDDKRRHLSSCGETLLGDFYDQPIRLSLVGYLRPELPFEGLDKLIAAIKNDIVQTEQLADVNNDNDTSSAITNDARIALEEKEWVLSDDALL